MLDRQEGTESRHVLGQTPGGAGIAVQPTQLLQLGPAVRTQHPPALDQQIALGLQDRQIPNPALLVVMDLRRRLAAPTTDPNVSRIGEQFNPYLRRRSLLTRLPSSNGPDLVSFPSAQHGGNLCDRQRRPPANPGVLDTNTKILQTRRCRYPSPIIREEPFYFGGRAISLDCLSRRLDVECRYLVH
jgi:hypothetical protein